MREGLDRAALDDGRPVKLRAGERPVRFRTSSGRIEILNPRLTQRLPRFLPTYVDRDEGAAPAGSRFPLRLMTAPSMHGLNSTFLQERDDLRARAGAMALQMSPFDAAARGLSDGDVVEAWNDLGAVVFELRISPGVPRGVVVAAGVRKLEDARGGRNVNALTKQRLTDEGAGSTFYDNAVDVRRGRGADEPATARAG
jgi:anaerobic selenocysteine-containing dehydrogenase